MRIPTRDRSAIVTIALLLQFLTTETFGQIEIEVGTTTVYPPAMGWFNGQISSFEAANPSIRVRPTALSQRLRPYAASIRDLPQLANNVIGIQTTADDEIAYLAEQGLIVPIDSFLPDPEFSRDVFSENLWEPVTYDNRMWGIPWCADSMWIFCNWPLFEKAGIDQPPRTWDDFLSSAQRLTQDTDGDGKLDQIGARLDSGLGLYEFLWLSLNAQRGVTYLQNGEVNFDQSAIRENLSLLQTILNSPYIDRDQSLSFDVQGGGEVGMIVINNFSQYAPRLVDALSRLFRDKRARAAPLPTNADNAFFGSLRLYLAVRRSTPELEAASWRFIKWIVRKDAPLPEFWFGFPIRKDIWETDSVRNWSAQFCRDFDVVIGTSARGRIPDIGFKRAGIVALPEIFSGFWNNRTKLDEVISTLNTRAPEFTFVRRAAPNVNEIFLDR